MAIKVSLITLSAILKDGPKSVDVVAAAMGRSNPHDFLADLEELDITLRGMRDLGLEGQLVTIFPARSRERYGFADLVPVIKGANPDAKRKPRKTPAKPVKPRKDGSLPVTYWPFVALGDIVPPPADEGVKYDGRWEEEEKNLNEIFAEDFKDESSMWHGWSVRATNGALKLIPPGE